MPADEQVHKAWQTNRLAMWLTQSGMGPVTPCSREVASYLKAVIAKRLGFAPIAGKKPNKRPMWRQTTGW
jgi:hypothetical protein